MQATLTQAVPTRSRRRAPARVLGFTDAQLVIGLVVVAAALRFPTLATQSFWHDEAVTVGRVLKPSLGGTLHAVGSSEATPPFYYVLAWLWTRVFGLGEFGIRSMSALFGVALVPVMWGAGRRLLWPRAGLVAAALTAVSPFLVWYSQEARAYILLAFLCGASLLLLARALERPSTGRLAAWAVVCALALATHYFAVFLIVPEALWLLLGAGGPYWRKAVAIAVPAAASLAVLPLALQQGGLRHDGWIGRIPLGTRLTGTAKAFVTDPTGAPSPLVYVVIGACIVIAVWLLWTRGQRDERSLVRPVLGLGLTAFVVPLALVAVGLDYFYSRNMVPAFLPLLLLVAAGLAVQRGGRVAAIATTALCVTCILTVIAVDVDSSLQRANWRDVASALGPAHTRALVVPFVGDDPLEYYMPHTKRLKGSTTVSEVEVVGWSRSVRARPPAPGFREDSRRRVGLFTIVRYTGPPHTFKRVVLAHAKLDPEHGAVLVEKGSPGK
jgi:uncharacterized membrane protein